MWVRGVGFRGLGMSVGCKWSPNGTVRWNVDAYSFLDVFLSFFLVLEDGVAWNSSTLPRHVQGGV